MGSPHLRRKNYKMAEDQTAPAIINEPSGYQFKVDGEDIDLTPYIFFEDRTKDIAWGFAIALWRRRNDISGPTAIAHLTAIDRFFEHLKGEIGTLSLDQINQSVIGYFTYWMKYVAVKRDGSNTPLSEGSKRHFWGTIRSYIADLISYGLVDEKIKLPVQVFDSNEGESFKPYTTHETEQIAAACKHDIAIVKQETPLTTGHGFSAYLAPLIPHAVLVSLRTGLNPEVLFEIEVTKHSLKSSHLLNSTRLVLPVKQRTSKSQNIELLDEDRHGVRIKNSIVRLLKEVEALTQPIRDSLSEDDPLRNKLWLVKSDEGRIDVFRSFRYYLSLTSFCKRHSILDASGELVNLNFRRFRPTFAEIMLKLNGGDLRDLQKRLGHSHIRTTMGYLDPNLEERKEAFHYSGKAMEDWALRDGNRLNPEDLAQILDIPLDAAEKLANGDFDMGAAKCKNPFNSPLKGAKEGDLCTNYLACFRCGNCVVLKEDSHRLFSFYFWLLRKKAALGEEKWEASYGWIIEIIDSDIAPQLGDELWIEQEKEMALNDPFPMWAPLDPDTSIVNTEGLV